ncbi:MAG: hypothetical protein U0003_01515 [Vampirovibrionales bacterium]
MSLTSSSSVPLAFSYHGLDLSSQERKKGIILAHSPEEARLQLRAQQIITLQLALLSSVNPSCSTESISSRDWRSPFNGTLFATSHWRTYIVQLLASLLPTHSLQQALLLLEQKLHQFNAPLVWQAALLLWRDGLSRGCSVSQCLQTFDWLWGQELMALFSLAEESGQWQAVLATWVEMHHQAQQYEAMASGWKDRCVGWAGVLALFMMFSLAYSPFAFLKPVTLGTVCLVAIILGMGLSWKHLPWAGLLDSWKARLTPYQFWAYWRLYLVSGATLVEALRGLQRLSCLNVADRWVAHELQTGLEQGQSLASLMEHFPRIPLRERLLWAAAHDEEAVNMLLALSWQQSFQRIAQWRRRGWQLLEGLLMVGVIGVVGIGLSRL